MSSETGSIPEQATLGECTYCSDSLSEKTLALQTYPGGDTGSVAGLVADGLLLCPDCADEPVELLDNWDSHPEPPVESDRAIGEGYGDVADACSFCGGSIGTDPVVGVECYRRPGETLPAYANYTLCPDCQDVFGEFLRNVRARASSTE